MLVLSLLSLAALAVASPVGNYVETLDERAITLTAGTLNDFRFYVQHSAAAYCNADTAAGRLIKCKDATCAAVSGNSAKVVASFDGGNTGIGGYVATDPARSEIVVSIRGSSNVRNWITNIQFATKGCSLVNGCRVHTGFQDAWDEIADSIKAAIASAKKANPSYRVIATGHSLGGAVATLAAAYLRQAGTPVNLYTFGSPRVGNDVFANFVTKQTGGEWRVTHGADPVPRLPPIVLGYHHVSPEYWLDGASGDVTYEVNEVKVCEGSANLNCNGHTLGLDVLAHLRYLQDVSACSPLGIFVKREAMSDAELEKQLNAYVKADIEYVEQGGK